MICHDSNVMCVCVDIKQSLKRIDGEVKALS